MKKLLLLLFLIPNFVYSEVDEKLILGAGYNDNPSCFYTSVSMKKASDPWRLSTHDLIEIKGDWVCDDIVNNDNQKKQGSRIIQMSCSKEKYMILDEYGYNHAWEMTNPEYNQMISSFDKARYISRKGLDSLIKLYCKN
jgi:hypothetical protein